MAYIKFYSKQQQDNFHIIFNLVPFYSKHIQYTILNLWCHEQWSLEHIALSWHLCVVKKSPQLTKSFRYPAYDWLGYSCTLWRAHTYMQVNMHKSFKTKGEHMSGWSCTCSWRKVKSSGVTYAKYGSNCRQKLLGQAAAAHDNCPHSIRAT